MPFIGQKRTLGFKLEAVAESGSGAYTPQSLAQGDYNVKVFNISYTPEIEATARKYASGDYSAFSSIMGKQMMTVSFSAHMAWSGANTTPPEWGKMLKASAYSETVLADGVRYLTDSDECGQPATIEIVEEQCGSGLADLVLRTHGAMGNVSFVLEALGTPVRMDFEFKGVLTSIEDRASGSHITPSFTDTTDPEAVLASTLTVFGEARSVDSVNINSGNQVEMFNDPSTSYGYRGAYVVNRDPTADLDPYLEGIATSADYSRWRDGTTGAFNMSVGDHITISAPAFQITAAYPAGDRNGFTANSISGILTRSAGDDELKILQGNE